MCGNDIDFCIFFFFYPETLLNSVLSCNCLSVDSLGFFFYVGNISSSNKDSFTFFSTAGCMSCMEFRLYSLSD